MGLFKNLSIAILVLINTISLLIGIAIIGLSSYGLATFAHWKQYISQTGLVICVIFGIFLFIVSMLGCFGAVKQNKVALGIYMVVDFVIAILLVAGAIVVLVWGGDLMKVDKEVGRSFSNFVTQAYHDCCWRAMVGASLPSLPINYNYSRPVQADLPNNPGQQLLLADKYLDALPETCFVKCNLDGTDPIASDQTQPNCIKDPQYTYKQYQCVFPKCGNTNRESIAPGYCATNVVDQGLAMTPEICNSISWLVYGDNKPNELQSCRSLQNWGGQLSSKVQDNLRSAGIGLAIIAVIIFMLFVFSVTLCCVHKDKFDATA